MVPGAARTRASTHMGHRQCRSRFCHVSSLSKCLQKPSLVQAKAWSSFLVFHIGPSLAAFLHVLVGRGIERRIAKTPIGTLLWNAGIASSSLISHNSTAVPQLPQLCLIHLAIFLDTLAKSHTNH